MRHLIYVPVLGQVASGIWLAGREAAAIRKAGIAECDVALVEHNSYNSRHNRTILEQVATEHPGVHFYHVTPGLIADLIVPHLATIADSPTAARIYTILAPHDSAYGAGPNKAALFAAAHGYDALHRRDADLVDPGPAVDYRSFPLYNEVRSLGRRARDVLSPDEVKDEPWADELVWMSGTSPRGDLPLDRRDLMEVDPSFVVELRALESSHPDLAASAKFVQSYFTESDFPELEREYPEPHLRMRIADRRPGHRIEVCVASYAAAWKLLPQLPTRATITADYVVYDLLRCIGSPVIRHDAAPEHRYIPERLQRSEAWMIDYGLRDVRQMLLNRLWSEQRVRFRQAIGTAPQSIYQDGLIPAYVQAFTEVRNSERQTLTDMRHAIRDVYRRAIKHHHPKTDDQVQRRLTTLASGIDSAGQSLVDDVLAGVDDFTVLTEHWPALLESLAKSDSSPCQLVPASPRR
ncbi:DUF6271 family protein [Microlunatus speluncae]|uniref:DUF6271 family protein n=1 Tax=Microlunatus speluncae TaxID=2594267 RepID=UPI0012662516|nr:DUF6271 family protein [Microlunatus speluncae]